MKENRSKMTHLSIDILGKPRGILEIWCIPLGVSTRLGLIVVPDLDMGCCLGSEGNGVSLGKGGEGGRGPPGGGKDKQSVPNKGRDNIGKDKEGLPSRTG
jgi:hypothetical protein